MEQLLTYVYMSRKINKYIISNIKDEEMREEFRHSIIEQIVKKDISYYQPYITKGHLDYLIIRIMINNLKSTSSPFYRQNHILPPSVMKSYLEGEYIVSEGLEMVDDAKYDMVSSNVVDEDLDKLLWDYIEEMYPDYNRIGSKDWYEITLFKMYHLENLTVAKIASLTKIDKKSIYYTLSNFKDKIKMWVYDK